MRLVLVLTYPDGPTHTVSWRIVVPDTPRYRALGNAVTVPVAAWIARRIVAADAAVEWADR